MNEKWKTTRGRPAKPLPDPSMVIVAVVKFLLMFIPESLAIRIVGIVLIAIGIVNEQIIELTGINDRIMWRAKKSLNGATVFKWIALSHGLRFSRAHIQQNTQIQQNLLWA